MTRPRTTAADERGYVLIYMAFIITALLLFSGVAVDAGRAYVVKAQLSKAVDGAWAGMGIGWAVVSTLIGGIVVWGGLGYLADRLLGLNPRILTAVGIVLGAGAAIYLVYLRFGKGEGNRGGA